MLFQSLQLHLNQRIVDDFTGRIKSYLVKFYFIVRRHSSLPYNMFYYYQRFKLKLFGGPKYLINSNRLWRRVTNMI